MTDQSLAARVAALENIVCVLMRTLDANGIRIEKVAGNAAPLSNAVADIIARSQQRLAALR
ncbi:MAG: hypothetical protein C4583_15575 [Anaerolineaceae bacterium]|nr:MAG: hypothetical protein C4583_15575 [Anaerolineaceae bacterium]